MRGWPPGASAERGARPGSGQPHRQVPLARIPHQDRQSGASLRPELWQARVAGAARSSRRVRTRWLGRVEVGQAVGGLQRVVESAHGQGRLGQDGAGREPTARRCRRAGHPARWVRHRRRPRAGGRGTRCAGCRCARGSVPPRLGELPRRVCSARLLTTTTAMRPLGAVDLVRPRQPCRASTGAPALAGRLATTSWNVGRIRACRPDC